MSKRVLILTNHFITIYNFRKELIADLINSGYEVFISTPEAEENKFFNDLGCKIIKTPVDRRGINPLKDIKLILHYIKIMLSVKPNIIFSYTIKPNIYGSIASNITKNKQICNITGTGATFMKKSTVSTIAKWLYRISIKKSYKVFFQNNGDLNFFVKNKMVKSNYSLLPGSGVNLDQYNVCELPSTKETNFIFIGRIMGIKGIDQYIESAKVIKEKYSNTNFYIAGFIEEEKYEKIINKFDKNGIVKYIGFQKDIKSLIERCSCTILPSHGGEGVPNVLLESAAMGRTCIASNISGSVDVIEDGKTGFVFKVGEEKDLIKKIETFLSMSFENQVKMGLAGREKVEKEFDRKIIINSYLDELDKVI
ncbi:glycosyltransferase family 4 protein [Rossellomorea marisflavi]|uniref:glycosyltransferase family 4 protein n=1 Tax=Rossellomorea marisflavi TaxID=189381 RepID=UPI0034590CC9